MSRSCFACGAPNVRDERGVHCKACGLDLVADGDGVLTVGSDARDVSYPETGADLMLQIEDTSFWFAHRNKVLSVVLERLADRGTIWDIGGGNGFQAKMLQSAGRDVVVVEPGPGSRNAARRGVKNVIRAPLEALHLRQASVGTFTLLDVVEHFADPNALLSECRRLLRPDGHVVVTVPAYDALWSDEDDYAGHHRRYTKGLLREHFARAGLELVWASHFFGVLIAPIFLMRALPYRLTKKKKDESNIADHEKGGLAQKGVELMLARELSALKKGRIKTIGASIIAVAAPLGTA